MNSAPPLSEPALAIRPVTISLLPPLERFVEELRGIWDSHWLTNNGAKLQAFEAALAGHLGTSQVLGFGNGGAGLHAAVAAMELPPGSEVITTPFTFSATTHVIAVNHLKPVFCDIEPLTLTLDPSKIRKAITSKTSAILGVHVFGIPCHVKEIDDIAQEDGLKVIYDGAHAFGVQLDGTSIAAWGDATMFSFNATKLLTTGEGGCVTFRDPLVGERLRRWRRWGMLEDGMPTQPGLNGMMPEITAALGICNLEMLAIEKVERTAVIAAYEEHLASCPGVTIASQTPAAATPALSYFVIRVNAARYGRTRDELLTFLRSHGVLAKAYFHPLTSTLPCYSDLQGASPELLPVATEVASETLSLPLYGSLGAEGAAEISRLITQHAAL